MRVQPLRNLVVAQLQRRVLRVRHDLRDEAEAARPDGEVQLRQTPEDVRPHALDGTAHQADDLARREQVPGLADGLFLGLLADGAAVDEDEFGRVLRRDLLMARRDKQRRDRLRVAHVHLTAVGMDQELHVGNLPYFSPSKTEKPRITEVFIGGGKRS